MLGIAIMIFALYFYFVPEKRYLSVYLLFVIVTAGFQISPVNLFQLPGAGLSKSYDIVLLFSGVVFFVQPKIYFNGDFWKKHKMLIVFFLLLGVLSFYSIIFQHVEKDIVIKVLRTYAFFLTVFLFLPLSLDDHKKVLRLIIYSTCVACAIYNLQPFVNKVFLNIVISEDLVILKDNAITRYFNVPVYIMIVMFFFFIDKSVLNLRFQNLLLALCLLALFFVQHRSIMMTIVVAYLLSLFLSKKINIIKLSVIVISGIALFNIANTLLDNRFKDGIDDLSKGEFKMKDIAYLETRDLPLLSTTDFRFFHFVERAEFILSKPETTFFGFGLITEESKLIKLLNFTVGTTSADNSKVPQVATGDIVWSILIINFGLFGTIIFVLLYCSFMIDFIKYRQDEIMKIGIYTVLGLFITSFYSTLSVLPYIIFFVMLLVSYSYKLSIQSNNEETSKH